MGCSTPSPERSTHRNQYSSDCGVVLSSSERMNQQRILVPHLPLDAAHEPSRRLREHPVHHAVRQRVVPVPQQILLVDEEVVVAVQLPELAVHDVKVLVREKSQNLVDVLLVVHVRHRLQQVAAPQLAQGHLPVPRRVHRVEDPIRHRLQVPVLKLGRLLQKLQPRMRVQHAPQQRTKICVLQVRRPSLILPRTAQHRERPRVHLLMFPQRRVPVLGKFGPRHRCRDGGGRRGRPGRRRGSSPRSAIGFVPLMRCIRSGAKNEGSSHTSFVTLRKRSASSAPPSKRSAASASFNADASSEYASDSTPR